METSIAQQIINKLNDLKRENLPGSYIQIKNILNNQRIIVPFTQFHPSVIIRYRKHHEKDPFFFDTSEQLSYRRDIMNISSFGRCNEPGQGLFYCNDKENENTGLTEAMSVFRGNTNSLEEIFTVGAWTSKSPLNLAVILPADEIKGKYFEFDSLKESYNNFEDSEDFRELKVLTEFISKEFILDVQRDKTNYSITSGFANYIRSTFPKIDGIIYGSVKSEHTGQNMVLWRESVDEKLDFIAARKFSLVSKNGKDFIQDQDLYSKGYDKENDKIIW